MMDQAKDAVSRLKGFDAHEVYCVRSTINAIYIDGSKISNAETKIDTGMCVRLSDDGKLGRASVTLSSNDDVEKCVKMASQVAGFSPKSRDFKGYPEKQRKIIEPKGISDNRILNIQPEDLRDIASTVIDSCDTDIPRGLIRTASVESVLMNSNGVVTEHKNTMVYGHFTSMTRMDHPGEGVETYYGTQLSLDAADIGKALSKKAKAAASATPFKGRKEVTMILPPDELGDMLMSSAGSALNGENVLYQRSLWKDSLNDNVASANVTLTDDPMTPSPLCSAFDDEGSPASKKVLVENGVLKGFIRDAFCGTSTGNGMRRSSVESQGIYENPVSVKPMNLVMSPGKLSLDEIISQTENGILVEKFAWPEADSLTGRFGLEVRAGHIIRNGEITETVNNALLMGNMIDALKNVELIGNDMKNMGCVTVPTVSFAGTELIGN